MVSHINRSTQLSVLPCMRQFTLIIVCICVFANATFRKRVLYGTGNRHCTKPRIFVCVFTDGSGAAKYAQRRAALRATWFPNTTDALSRLECTYGMTIRFVVGSGALTNDTDARKAWHAELDAYDDFLKLDVLDTYPAMTGKTAKMFRHVMSLPQDYEYVVKVDDDMFLSPMHLAKAVEQWADMKADYVGCMTNPGTIYRTEGHIWFEPLHDLLASHMHMYACGSIYALSRSALTHIFKDGAEFNRFFAIEDQAMGLWMLAHNVTHFDDRRLCAKTCDSSHAFVAVNNGETCTGMIDPYVELPAVHRLAECHVPPPAQLPFLESKFQRFNRMIEAYEHAHGQ